MSVTDNGGGNTFAIKAMNNEGFGGTAISLNQAAGVVTDGLVPLPEMIATLAVSSREGIASSLVRVFPAKEDDMSEALPDPQPVVNREMSEQDPVRSASSP